MRAQPSPIPASTLGPTHYECPRRVHTILKLLAVSRTLTPQRRRAATACNARRTPIIASASTSPSPIATTTRKAQSPPPSPPPCPCVRVAVAVNCALSDGSCGSVTAATIVCSPGSGPSRTVVAARPSAPVVVGRRIERGAVRGADEGELHSDAGDGLRARVQRLDRERLIQHRADGSALVVACHRGEGRRRGSVPSIAARQGQVLRACGGQEGRHEDGKRAKTRHVASPPYKSGYEKKVGLVRGAGCEGSHETSPRPNQCNELHVLQQTGRSACSRWTMRMLPQCALLRPPVGSGTRSGDLLVLDLVVDGQAGTASARICAPAHGTMPVRGPLRSGEERKEGWWPTSRNNPGGNPFPAS